MGPRDPHRPEVSSLRRGKLRMVHEAEREERAAVARRAYDDVGAE